MGGSFYGEGSKEFRELMGRDDRQRRRITDTTKETLSEGGALGFLAASMGSGGVARAIEEQEAQGQHELVNSMQLPRQMGYDANDRAAYEKLGFKFAEEKPGEQLKGDKLFIDAALPEGWKKVRTDHSMWSNIVDTKGRVRVTVFYKAAFYDRDAHMGLVSRFTTKTLRSEYDPAVPKERDGEVVFMDLATGKELFSAGAKREGKDPVTGEWVSPSDDCRAFAKQYLEGKDRFDFDAVYE